MADLARSVATLRIEGDTLVPGEVTTLLGCDPTRSHALGDVLSSRRTPAKTADFGLWSLEAAEAAPADLDAQVASILGRLPRDAQTWQQLGARFDLSLFCGWFMEHWNEGVSIASGTLQALAERGIRLDVDLYGGEEADADAEAGPEGRDGAVAAAVENPA